MNKRGLRNLGKRLRKFGKAGNYYDFIKNEEFYKRAKVVLIYKSLPKEAPTDELIKCVMAEKAVAVPVMVGDDLKASLIDDTTAFNKGGFSVDEPSEIKEINKEEIDLFIVPGVLFDKTGARLGYGKGFFDRFLTTRCKVGLAFSSQVIERFPTDEHDIYMDYILTEKGLVKVEKIT